MNAQRIHLIANAHLDPVWLWRWEEGCTESLSTFQTACDLLDEYDDFIFCHNEALIYEWVRIYDSALFDRIKKHVANGKWHIMGGWYLQPDCNMPSGESIVRNILYGRIFFTRYFGKRPSTAINFDSFGHSMGLVQILKLSGYDSYVIYRPASDNYDFINQDFIWKGFNNSSVVVHRSDEGYNSVFGLASQKLASFLGKNTDEPLHQAHPSVIPQSKQDIQLFLWGVGDHGGGPTRIDLVQLKEFINQYPELDIAHSFPENYFQDLHEHLISNNVLNQNADDSDQNNVVECKYPGLPVVSRGLNPVSPGCYTSQIQVKQKHRELENEIYATEKMASAACILEGKTYPSEVFQEAIHDLVFSEFHDALPGSGSPEVEADTLRVLDHGLELMSRKKLASLIALSVHTPRGIPNTSTVMLCNPHPYRYIGVVDVEVGLPVQNWKIGFMYPEARINGLTVPVQAVKETSNFSLDWRKRLLLQVELPASSMTRCDITFNLIPERPTYPEIMSSKEFLFSDGDIRARVSTNTGLVDQLIIGEQNYMLPGSFQLVTTDDTNSPWGIHSKTSYGRRPFVLADAHEASDFMGLSRKIAEPIHIIEDGQVQTVVEAIFTRKDSRACVRYIFPKSGEYMDLDIIIDFREKEQTLKIDLPLAHADDATFKGQIMFGRETLNQNGEEIIHQKWLMVERGDGHALAVLNNGIHGASYNKGTLSLTLLRSAGYTASDFLTGKALQEERWAPRMEQGIRRFSFRIIAGLLDDISPELDRLAQAFNERIYAVAYNPPGTAVLNNASPQTESFFTIDNPAIVVSAFKHEEKSIMVEEKNKENQLKFVLRLFESSGQPQTTKVDIPALNIHESIRFEPFEIRTFQIDPIKYSLTSIDLLEGM